jgi:hypothetical protein
MAEATSMVQGPSLGRAASFEWEERTLLSVFLSDPFNVARVREHERKQHLEVEISFF